ncbi:MAG: YgfZ/GcvT domain-containing protein [Stackebrandtia sp.]
MTMLLSRSGAVRETEDSVVAWHYGDPLREQRLLATTGALVDRGDRDVLTVSGPDRLTWLHSLTTQHLLELGDELGAELTVLSPQGRVEHHAVVFHDAGNGVVWLDTEPGAGAGLREFLTKMRFFSQVEIADVSAEFGLLTYTGPYARPAPDVLDVPGPKFPSGTLPARPSTVYAGCGTPEGGFERRTDALGFVTVDRMIPRSELERELEAASLDKLPPAGMWAYDTLRIPALRPRVGVDTDDKTIPHETPSLLRAAVHLDKGCYRGQETVARVHNMGKPPRRLAMLHLDGTQEQAPPPGTEVKLATRTVGVLGTASRHYEDGMIALALLRRNVADDPKAELTAAGMAARQ